MCSKIAYDFKCGVHNIVIFQSFSASRRSSYFFLSSFFEEDEQQSYSYLKKTVIKSICQ